MDAWVGEELLGRYAHRVDFNWQPSVRWHGNSLLTTVNSGTVVPMSARGLLILFSQIVLLISGGARAREGPESGSFYTGSCCGGVSHCPGPHPLAKLEVISLVGTPSRFLGITF
jgi:hypothetical protein